MIYTKINLIILNYNGEKLLSQCLPSIIEAKNYSSHDVKVTVIDNESTDNSLEVLRKYTGEISVLPLRNRVLCSFNRAIENQTEDIAILLNNDIRVDKDFVDPLVNKFAENDDAFLVAPKCFDFNGVHPEGGRSKGFVKYGWFGALAKYPGWENDIDKPRYTFQSGFGAVRRDRFLELGGYDDLYRPGRLEDSDICFRAWKRGWRSYYVPGSVVYHMGGESFGRKFGRKGVSAIDSRNSALFFWKNISDPVLWFNHIIYLPLRIIWWIFRGDIPAVRGFFQAFSRISEVVRKRKVPSVSNMTDKEIFNMFRE